MKYIIIALLTLTALAGNESARIKKRRAKKGYEYTAEVYTATRNSGEYKVTWIYLNTYNKATVTTQTVPVKPGMTITLGTHGTLSDYCLVLERNGKVRVLKSRGKRCRAHWQAMQLQKPQP
jgi:hypothetical protein